MRVQVSTWSGELAAFMDARVEVCRVNSMRFWMSARVVRESSPLDCHVTRRFGLHATPTGAKWHQMLRAWLGASPTEISPGWRFDRTMDLIREVRAYVSSWRKHRIPFIWMSATRRTVTGAPVKISRTSCEGQCTAA